MNEISSMAMPAADEDTDRAMMRAAIALGRRALGTTAPNPAVGCIVARDGIVVGRGSTRAGGRPHAETEALADAGELARGATLYVSLEPCSHHGVTPPCAEAIIKAGIARVVSAMNDPDPRVAGRGHSMMRDAGIDVVVGVEQEAALRSHYGHILRVTEGRPAVTLKLAETLDGYVAGDVHDARLMITGQAANNRVQVMRSMHDAIMVGIGTALLDDPLMTVRLPGLAGHRPLRVVLDAHLRLNLRSRLVATARDFPTLVLCRPDAPGEAMEALTERGVTVEHVTASEDGHIDLRAALAALARRGVTRVFSEGGPTVAAALIGQGLADKVILFTSPKPLGREGVAAFSKEVRAMLGDETRFAQVEDRAAGDDRMRVWRRSG